LVLASLPEHRSASQPQLRPFGHLGIQLATRDEVDIVAQRARLEGCLVWEAEDNPAPVGYLCAVSDPDGNVIEFSFGQVVYEVAHAKWGNGSIS
jgi:catechol 2,3-dioxygenase-like lactoylglutathione lyase family enzyme